jgi:succinate dehydrogenase flavin-adding protein (antitoxin of CptAB toxin-antitoxin module)
MAKSDDIAKPTISAVLEEFLKEETSKLSPATQGEYQDIVELLTHSLDGYAYQHLDKADSEKFDRLYNEEETEFCDIFGPEHILPNLDDFLSDFMVRKVIADKETLRAAGTVTKKLAAWLERKGYVSPSESSVASKKAAEAAKRLPKAEECAQLLYEFAQEQSVGATGGLTFDHFKITKIEPGKLWLESIMSNLSLGPIAVPKEVSSKCEAGWSVSLMLGKKDGEWVIVDAGNVYPL